MSSSDINEQIIRNWPAGQIWLVFKNKDLFIEHPSMVVSHKRRVNHVTDSVWPTKSKIYYLSHYRKSLLMLE